MSSIHSRRDHEAHDYRQGESDVPHGPIVSAMVSFDAAQQSPIGLVVAALANVFDLRVKVTTKIVHVLPLAKSKAGLESKAADPRPRRSKRGAADSGGTPSRSRPVL